MFRKITVAVVLSAATFAVTAGPASAARYLDSSGEDTTFSYQPTGTRAVAAEKPHGTFQTGDKGDGCNRAVEAANSWQASAADKYAKGDATWKQDQGKADAIAGEANRYDGCNITYQD